MYPLPTAKYFSGIILFLMVFSKIGALILKDDGNNHFCSKGDNSSRNKWFEDYCSQDDQKLRDKNNLRLVASSHRISPQLPSDNIRGSMEKRIIIHPSRNYRENGMAQRSNLRRNISQRKNTKQVLQHAFERSVHSERRISMIRNTNGAQEESEIRGVRFENQRIFPERQSSRGNHHLIREKGSRFRQEDRLSGARNDLVNNERDSFENKRSSDRRDHIAIRIIKEKELQNTETRYRDGNRSPNDLRIESRQSRSREDGRTFERRDGGLLSRARNYVVNNERNRFENVRNSDRLDYIANRFIEGKEMQNIETRTADPRRSSKDSRIESRQSRSREDGNVFDRHNGRLHRFGNDQRQRENSGIENRERRSENRKIFTREMSRSENSDEISERKVQNHRANREQLESNRIRVTNVIDSSISSSERSILREIRFSRNFDRASRPREYYIQNDLPRDTNNNLLEEQAGRRIMARLEERNIKGSLERKISDLNASVRRNYFRERNYRNVVSRVHDDISREVEVLGSRSSTGLNGRNIRRFNDERTLDDTLSTSKENEERDNMRSFSRTQDEFSRSRIRYRSLERISRSSSSLNEEDVRKFLNRQTDLPRESDLNVLKSAIRQNKTIRQSNIANPNRLYNNRDRTVIRETRNADDQRSLRVVPSERNSRMTRNIRFGREILIAGSIAREHSIRSNERASKRISGILRIRQEARLHNNDDLRSIERKNSPGYRRESIREIEVRHNIREQDFSSSERSSVDRSELNRSGKSFILRYSDLIEKNRAVRRNSNNVDDIEVRQVRNARSFANHEDMYRVSSRNLRTRAFEDSSLLRNVRSISEERTRSSMARNARLNSEERLQSRRISHGKMNYSEADTDVTRHKKKISEYRGFDNHRTSYDKTRNDNQFGDIRETRDGETFARREQRERSQRFSENRALESNSRDSSRTFQRNIKTNEENNNIYRIYADQRYESNIQRGGRQFRVQLAKSSDEFVNNRGDNRRESLDDILHQRKLLKLNAINHKENIIAEEISAIGPWFRTIQIALATIILGQLLLFSGENEKSRVFSGNSFRKLKCF